MHNGASQILMAWHERMAGIAAATANILCAVVPGARFTTKQVKRWKVPHGDMVLDCVREQRAPNPCGTQSGFRVQNCKPP